MSRSIRRPYSAPCGNASAHQDKIYAARGVRRAQNRAVREAQDWGEFELPHRFECSHNDVCDWRRDGKQRLCSPPDRSWYSNYWWRSPERQQEYFDDAVVRYKRLFRK